MRINSFTKLVSIPKSLYVSIRLCGLSRGILLPILVRYNTKLVDLNGKLEGNGKLDFGFGGIGIFDNKHERCILEIKGGGTVVVKGYSHWGPRCRFSVGKMGTLTIGDNVANSAACTIIAMKNVNIGDDTIISWDTLIMDSDFHKVKNLFDGNTSNLTNSITIESNCWLGARCVILKGTFVHKGSIIGANTTCTKDYIEDNVLIVGTPGLVKKRGIMPMP